MSRARSLTCDSLCLTGTANAQYSDRTRCRTTHFFEVYRDIFDSTRQPSEVFKPNAVQCKYHHHQPFHNKYSQVPVTMKTFVFTATALVFASSVSAQTACDPVASAIPTCGVPCISSAAVAAGCGSNDYRCRCSSSSVIQASALNCVVGNCGIATALQVQAGAASVCACVATATGNLVEPTAA